MPEPGGGLAFALTRLWFGLRDLFVPPSGTLGEAGIAPGMHLLDYGCGPGSYALAAARLVGENGRVYAADVDPRAVAGLRAAAARKGLTNVHPILTGCATGLEDGSIDVALLYDTLHDLHRPLEVLQELHRVLKPGGLLSFSDHHLHDEEILSLITGSGLFSLVARGRRTYAFQAAGHVNGTHCLATVEKG